jgi:cytochrome c-type biogenesis protein CcmH
MYFWVIATVIAAAVTGVLLRALSRQAEEAQEATADHDLRVYRDQLETVERDVERGIVPAEDAERLRTEISRRILAADAKASSRGTAVHHGPRKAVMAFIVLALVLGSLALYRELGAPGYGDMALQDRIAFAETLKENRPSQAEAAARISEPAVPEGVSDQVLELIEKLRAAVAERPDDLQGQKLLAQNEARIGRFAAAAAAQGRVLALAEEPTARDFADYAELLILAAGGYISPEAETALRAALAQDETDGRSRYYVGLLMAQTGRPDVTFRIWDALLRRGPEDAPWIRPIRGQIMEMAARAGVDYEQPAPAAPGPTAADLEAAEDMTPEDRMQFIAGMVEGLSNRLATEGGPPEDWARLVTSLAVLDQNDRAAAIYDNALEVFAGNAAALDRIRRAGEQAGITE